MHKYTNIACDKVQEISNIQLLEYAIPPLPSPLLVRDKKSG